MTSSFQVALRQIRRTPYQVLAAIMVMVSTFFAISVFYLISLGSIKILKFFEAAPQVIAFFERGKDLDQSQISQIKNQLEVTGKLASLKYVSTHEAEAIYREKNKDDPLLLELVNYKILPPSIEISAINLDDLVELKNILEKQPGVKDIAFYEDIVSSLSAWIKNIRWVGIGIIGYLLIQSVLIIVIIIGMKIQSKKEEIEILKLIGATASFISKPFIVEGIFYGVVGALIAWVLTYIVLLYSTPILIIWLKDINILPVDPLVMLTLLGGEVLGGVIIGSLGSFFAVHRFLR